MKSDVFFSAVGRFLIILLGGVLAAVGTFTLTSWLQMTSCSTGVLSYNYCGEITGMINQMITSTTLSGVAFVAVVWRLYAKLVKD